MTRIISNSFLSRRVYYQSKASLGIGNLPPFDGTNPAGHLSPPRFTEPPTAPFTREEFASILHACDT